MRLTTVGRAFHSVPVTIFVITIFCLIIWAGTRDQADAIRPQAPRLRRVLLRKLLERDHRYIPANDPSFEYFGRWLPTLNQLRRDVSFPGAYIEFDIANTSSLYIKLRNVHKVVSPPNTPTKVTARQLFVQPARHITPPSGAVSLLVQIDQDQFLYFNQSGHDVLLISSTLKVTNSHGIKVMYLGATAAGNVLEFEGVWVDKGGYLSGSDSHAATENVLGSQSTGSVVVSPRRRYFEVVTSLAYEDLSTATNAWPQTLASMSNASFAVFPTSSYCLTSTCPSAEVPFSDLYFRSGPPGSSHFQLPYRFGSSHPAALVLDIGLIDYESFLAVDPSSHAINHFTTTFVQQYTTFVSTVRSTAYPYHSPYTTQQYGTLAIDASFTYNSAPSTLPIFLLTPFTASKRLHRLLSHAVSETVNTLQAQGDKSTFWIDTSGWLTGEDFAVAAKSPEQGEKLPDTTRRHPVNITSLPSLTRRAHRKIATYLSYHLCPYLSPASGPSDPIEADNTTTPLSSRTDTTANARCPFNRYDNYLGHLYVPIEADMSKMLEERKIELVKKFLGMEQALH